MGDLIMFSPLPPHLIWAMISILILLILASVIVGLIQALKGEIKGISEVAKRIKTWWIMSGIFISSIFVHPSGVIIVFLFISYLALKEYFTLIPTRRADRRVLLLAYLSLPVQYIWIAQGWYGMFILWIPLYMFLMIPMRMVLIGDTKDFLRSAATIHWGLMMTVFSLSHVPAFLFVDFHPEVVNPAGAAGIILFVVGLTQLNDILQFLWGKSLGKHRVVPSVSPGKTVEGLVGALITTCILAVITGPLLTPMDWQFSLKAGIIIGLGGFLGDITVSALKRDLGVKDSGGLLPGHGGILDRVDSLLFTAPLMFHYIRYLYGMPSHGLV
jgi:phosphatidate cytidylyltransferase